MSNWLINSSLTLSNNDELSSSQHPFNLYQSGDTIRIGTRRTPSSSNAAGYEGEVCFDDNYVYLYSTGQWNRIAINRTTF